MLQFRSLVGESLVLALAALNILGVEYGIRMGSQHNATAITAGQTLVWMATVGFGFRNKMVHIYLHIICSAFHVLKYQTGINGNLKLSLQINH